MVMYILEFTSSFFWYIYFVNGTRCGRMTFIIFGQDNLYNIVRNNNLVSERDLKLYKYQVRNSISKNLVTITYSSHHIFPVV